jgi:hypothetical protein
VAALTRHLLTLRHRYIVPLLHPGGAVEGMMLKTAPGMVAVSWRFPSGTLSLALNIGTKPVDLPALAGRRASPGRRVNDVLPPNGIVVRFADGEASL